MSDVPRHIRWSDVPGIVLVLTALTIMGIAARRWELVVVLGTVCLLQPLVGRRLVWRRSPVRKDGGPSLLPVGLIGALVLALPFAGLTQLWEVRGSSGLLLNLPWYVSLYLLSLAVLKIYAPRDSRRFGVVLFASAAALATCGADVKNSIYVGFVIDFAVVALVGLRLHMPQAPAPAQPRRHFAWVAFVGFGIVTLLVTGGASFYVSKNLSDWRQAYRRLTRNVDLLPKSPGGFSDQAQLGDVEEMKARGRQVALRAHADSPPGYLRGRAFLLYEGGAWTSRNEGVSLNGRGTDPGRVLLPGRPRALAVEPELRIYTAERYGAHLFVPLQTAEVETSDKALSLFPGNTVKGTGVSSARGYGVCLSPVAVRDRPARPEWLALPDDAELDAALDATGRKLALGDGRGPASLVVAIQRHFARYRYKVGIRFDPDRDPLAQFLSEKQHGHCELFASAGTLLLRKQGVPARYVTGFVCEEKSSLDSGLYVSRSEHAHAWVEYYDPTGGWTLAEFTPAGALPPITPAQGGEAFLDWLAGVAERIKGAFHRDGVKALLLLLRDGAKAALVWLVESPWRVSGVVLIAVGLVLVRRWRRKRLPKARARAPRVFSPALAVARDEHLALERRLSKLGFPRAVAETLSEYADRLEGTSLPDRERAVASIHAFAALRYARQIVRT